MTRIKMLFVLNGLNICLQDMHLEIQQQPFLIATNRLVSTVIIMLRKYSTKLTLSN